MRQWRNRYGIGPAPASMVVRRADDIVKQLRREHGPRKALEVARMRQRDVQQLGDPTALRIWELVVGDLESRRGRV